jgi:hypothetical protein
MYLSISDEERRRAIQHVVKNVPKETLLQIYEEISRDPDWLIMQHFGIGIEIRNLLRAKGFAWDDTTLDREWEPITLEAVRTAYGNM